MAEILAALSALFAAIATVATLRQTSLQHRFQRLSVRPELRIDVSDDPHLNVRLVNCGFGPARVTRFSLSYRVGNTSEQLNPRHLADGTKWSFLKTGDHIAPGEAINVLSFTRHTTRDAILLQCEVHYESPYGDRTVVREAFSAPISIKGFRPSQSIDQIGPG